MKKTVQLYEGKAKKVWADNDDVVLVDNKDRFRRDLGGVEGAYQEIMRRIFGK